MVEFQPSEILRVLGRHEVDYVLFGGLAASAHGSPLLTNDVDITPERSTANLARLSDALSDLGARIRIDREEPLPFSHDAESLNAATFWNLSTRFGDVDISFEPSGTKGYSDLVRDAVPITVRGVVVNLAALADVIRSKEAANRDKDRRSLPVLREILAQGLHKDSTALSKGLRDTPGSA